MLTGVHALIYSTDPEADRAFFRDVLGFPYVDNGGGWLIFKLPPAELGVHGGENGFHQLYLICDDADEFVGRMAAKGIRTDPISEEDWGRSTGVTLPGGGKLGIYQATHARA
jgi:catechol 2,3-dioxygenase-like lactoylglutathione lyase family enzyme